jgi:hypothetical protein
MRRDNSMKNSFNKTIPFTVILWLTTIFNSTSAFSQSTDSLAHLSSSSGAIQFQLLGGLGIYYIGDWNSASQYRIGADFSISHTNQSGGGITYTFNTVPATGGQYNTTQPNQISNSYQFSLSALYLQRIIEYNHALFYCGVGPTLSYDWGRSNDKTTYFASVQNNTGTQIYNNENTTRTSAIGPLAIIGVRSRLLDHVSLTAELGLSALYEWTMQSYSYNSTTNGPGSNRNASTTGNISHLDGWTISLTDIRIGLAIQL